MDRLSLPEPPSLPSLPGVVEHSLWASSYLIGQRGVHCMEEKMSTSFLHNPSTDRRTISVLARIKEKASTVTSDTDRS